MMPKENNYAFIDTQNTHKGIKSLGWKIDWRKFRIYLSDKYAVSRAFLFLGKVDENRKMYEYLILCGYEIVFKPVVSDIDGNMKGNCDADLVLNAMIEWNNYERAVIVSSDGDFYSLVRYLVKFEKLRTVLSPYVKTCSKLLKKEAKDKINYMDNLRKKIGINENAPHEDKTS